MNEVSQAKKKIICTLAALKEVNVNLALIGDHALAVYQIVRKPDTTDPLVDIDSAHRIDSILSALEYRCRQLSPEAARYNSDDVQLDFLFASRPTARQLLVEAVVCMTCYGPMPVVRVEGLIAFKLQGYVNDLRRKQYLQDIRDLLASNAHELRMNVLRGYFRLFGRELLLEELLE